MMLEEGNVLLLIGERRSRDFHISASDGSNIAKLKRVSKGQFSLLRSSGAALFAEVCAVVLDEREVADAPARPRLNHMMIAAVRPPPPPSLSELFDSVSLDGGAPVTPPRSLQARSPLARELGRPEGELLAALLPPDEAQSSEIMRVDSRLPAWDEAARLLTLDYPPGRASCASVQNFQLLEKGVVPSAPASAAPSWPPSPMTAGSEYDEDESSDAGSVMSLAYSACLVHGMVDDGPDTQTFSMDFRAPLSPLIAFAACLAAQDWA